jgi:adenosine deaminase
MSDKISVLVVPSDRFGVGLYRSVSPHTQLDKLYGDEFDVEINYQPNWQDLQSFNKYDIVHVHKGLFENLNAFWNALDYFKKNNIVSIIDIDDNWEVGPSHPLYHQNKSMHIAEKIDDDEMIKLIECKPLRMGHGIYVNEKGVELMNKYKIDCEICLTSNIVSRSIDKFDNHPIAANKNYKGKLFFCCDDKGLFRTCLTNELFIAINNYYKDLDESKQKDIIKKLCLDGIKASFLEDNIKKELIEYVESYKL